MADKKQLVFGLFENEAVADAAVTALKEWDKATDDLKLGAIGILVKDGKGQIKSQKLGARAGKKGVGVGVILGVIAAVLSGGVTLIGGLVGGALLGGVMGSFFHKGLGLSKEDLARLGNEIDTGHAVVGVLVEPAEAEAVTAKLAELGGKVETHEVSGEALDQAADAEAGEPAAAETVEPAVTPDAPPAA